MSTLETSSSQQGMKGYICRHTCGCKLRHSTEFTRTSVSSQGALWYHEHNDTLHPKHTHECEYERYKNTRKIKDGKDKKDIKPDKLLFQSYQKNAIGGKFNSQGISVINGNDNIAGGIRKDNNGSGSPTLQTMANLTSKSMPLYQEDQFKRKSSLQDDQSNKRIRVAMEGIAYPNQYTFDETQFLKNEIKDLQEQVDFLKIQYIEQFLPKDKVDGNNYSNNINLLKRVVPQFLHDIWFKNCKNTTEYQKRIIEILTTIIEFFDPDNNKNATTSSPSIPSNGNENVQSMMNSGNIMATDNLSKAQTEEATPVVDTIIKDPLNHTIANTVGAVNTVDAVNTISAVGQTIDNNHFITNTALNEDDLSNTNSSTIVANNIETLESISDTTKNPTIINIEAVQAPPEIVSQVQTAEAKAAELTPVIKLDPTATTTIDLTATLGSIKDDDAATLNNTINELSQKTSIINSIQLSTQMAQAAPAAVKPETTLVATAALPSTFALQATNELDVMKK